MEKNWEKYEKTAQHLLNKFADHFGVGQFDGKQVISGESGTTWEIDAKGYNADDCKFIIVESKRYTKNGIPQSIAASLAYVINDTGAEGGILVSPIGFQEGAKKVANSSKITEVTLKEDSTIENYIINFLGITEVGITAVSFVEVRDQVTTVIIQDGKIVRTETLGNIEN